jgi:hypothetical protein
MRCTKQETLLIHGRWFEERSPLLLTLATAPATDGIRLQRWIVLLETDDRSSQVEPRAFRCGLIRLHSSTKRNSLWGSLSRRELSGSNSCIRLDLSVCKSHQTPNGAAPQAQLSLIEAL